MEKTNNGNQEKKPEGLKNSRYWENYIPEKDETKKEDPNRLPDCCNGEFQKSLH